jgi:hypothetical protein
MTTMFKKITTGFVIQDYDENGKCISQSFVAGDDVQFEDKNGNPLETDDGEKIERNHEYFPFDMVQPQTVEVVDFVSEYDDGSILVSPAKYDASTGQISDIHAIDINMTGMLSREFIIRRSGEEIEICLQCHEHTMKAVMLESVASKQSLEELKTCRGGCDND